MADCEQPTRTLTKFRFRQFQRFILSRLTVGAQIRHGNPPFLRLTAEFERSEKPATSRIATASSPHRMIAVIILSSLPVRWGGAPMQAVMATGTPGELRGE